MATSSAQELKLVAFPGGFNLPVGTGMAIGAFAGQGIDIRIEYIPDSVTQMKGLFEGAYDVAMTAMDNVIAYHEGSGSLSVRPGAATVGVSRLRRWIAELVRRAGDPGI
jgi:ABC-type nitrate/sulfonate/bicarbonate transport system substrate-binding protein